MCGILGVIKSNQKIDRHLFANMLLEIKHRGPENEGLWFNQQENVAFGHRRLAVIDLSLGGHQPMIGADGRFVITYNGEIYNYRELKRELENMGHVFKSQSDTEVLLAGYMRWGKDCLQKINGMFALAIWDNKEQKLFAARDRLGEKPFKYYFDENKFIFASEIKAILADRTVDRKVDWQAVDMALTFRFVGAPETGFINIKKLPAGHYLIWQNNTLKVEQYWNAEDAREKYQGSVSELKKETWALFVDSVKKRLVADVPVGAFLSGGIDSTSVIAAIRELNVASMDTFVISLGGKSEDQKYAAIAAKYFGTRHHEIELGSIDYGAALQRIIGHYDEPFFDQSALPSMLISEEMKKYVTVVLSGDGGDELFGGYEAYALLGYMRNFTKIPLFLRKRLSDILFFNKAAQYRVEILTKQAYLQSYTEYYALWKTSLPQSKKYLTKEDLYLPEFKNKVDMEMSWQKMNDWFGKGEDIFNNAMMADFRGRLADGYLTKTDIATMASAVELRPPFLDHRLVEWAQRIPGSLKIKGGQTKWLWKEVVENKIPKEIIDRKKIGFSIPLEKIIKSDLRQIVETSILSPDSIITEVFSIETIKRLWSDHLNNRADYSNHLWSLLMLELWLQKYIKN